MDRVASKTDMEAYWLYWQNCRLPDGFEKMMGYDGDEAAFAIYFDARLKESMVISPKGVERGGNTALMALIGELVLDRSISQLIGGEGRPDDRVPVALVFERGDRTGFYTTSAFQAYRFFKIVVPSVEEMHSAILANVGGHKFPVTRRHMADVVKFRKFVDELAAFAAAR